MKRVLVCDDDKSLLYIMTFALTGIDWEVHTSEDCDNIIGKVDEFSPSVIIMDKIIPLIGGFETIKLLKSNPRTSHIPVILCTSDINISVLAKESGADLFLSKPFEIKKIEKLMDEAYELHKIRNINMNGLDQAETA